MKSYFFTKEDYDGTGIAIIAENIKEARKIAFHHNDSGYSWPEMCTHIYPIGNADILGLPQGVFNGTPEEGVQRGLYDWWDVE